MGSYNADVETEFVKMMQGNLRWMLDYENDIYDDDAANNNEDATDADDDDDARRV